MSNRNSILIRIIVWGVVAVMLLSALVVLLSRSAGGQSAFTAPVWGDLRVMQEESFALDAIEDLEFDFSSMNITVYHTEESEMKVKLLANRELRADERFVSSKDSGRITIQNKPLMQSVFFFSWFSGFKKLEVYLPAQYQEKLSIKTSSGDVTLPDDTLNLRQMRLHASSGNLRGGSVQAEEEISIGLTSGDIRLQEVKSARYQVQVTSGNTSINAIEGVGSIGGSSGDIRIGTLTGGEQNLSTASGNITLERFTGSGTISTQSGEIRMASVLPQGDLDVRVTSGNVSMGLEKAAAAKVEASVTSGTIRSTMPLTYGHDDKRASGEIGENPSAMLSIRTTSGGIRLFEAE